MKFDRARWTRIRIILVFCVFVFVWGGLIWRAVVLQILDRDHLLAVAEKEYSREIRLNPIRGDIYDRNGEKLAVTLMVDSIYASPIKVANPEDTAAKLASALNLDQRALLKKLQNGSSFIWVKRLTDPDEAARVRGFKLEGVGFIKEGKRFYPNLSLAAHVMGFVGVDSQGLAGLEVEFNEELKGTAGSWPVLRDAMGRVFQDLHYQDRSAQKGNSLHLTVDHRIQYVVEKALENAVVKHNAAYGAAIVVRPQTGEILALALAPAYNPNAYERFSPKKRGNWAVTDTFDPGSTFKVFLVAAALEKGVVTPYHQVDCENGSFTIGRRVIHDTHEYGLLQVQEVVKYSSNIGAAKIGQILGSAGLYEYLTAFGFGSRTGIDLPGESAGQLRPYQKWREVDAANVAFGQGVSVTAVQMVMAMSALANDGRLMRPYLVRQVTDSAGNTIKTVHPRMVREVISPETALSIRKMLAQVMESDGTGCLAQPMGYPSAGKTGTAQKFDRESNRYSNNLYVSSFLGFMPYENPQMTVFVVLDQPRPLFYGGVVAGPVFKEIGEKVLPLLNVAPLEVLPENPESPLNPREKENLMVRRRAPDIENDYPEDKTEAPPKNVARQINPETRPAVWLPPEGD